MFIESVQLRKVSEAVNAAFYPVLSQTLLLIYEINPYRIHATWHISRTDYIKACKICYLPESGILPLVLCFYDLSIPDSSGGLPLSFRLPVEGATNNWYVDLPARAETLIADLGVQQEQGNFIWLATSNMVQIPPACPTPIRDTKTVLAWPEKQAESRTDQYVQQDNMEFSAEENISDETDPADSIEEWTKPEIEIYTASSFVHGKNGQVLI